MKLDTNEGHSLDEFLVSLNETIAFGIGKNTEGDLRAQFRTPSLSPWPLAGSRKDIVQWTITIRCHLVSREFHRRPFRPALAPGRLILFEPDIELSEGLGVSETLGFIDENDAPPWDTWVAWICETRISADPFRYLVSWVPDPLIDLVQAAADVCTTDALRWLDKEPCVLRDQLQERGII